MSPLTSRKPNLLQLIQSAKAACIEGDGLVFNKSIAHLFRVAVRPELTLTVHLKKTFCLFTPTLQGSKFLNFPKKLQMNNLSSCGIPSSIEELNNLHFYQAGKFAIFMKKIRKKKSWLAQSFLRHDGDRAY